jgi:hypothetical protein
VIDVIPKKELIRMIKAFMADKNRGIPLELFAELCGVDKTTLYNVFDHEKYPLTEHIPKLRMVRGYGLTVKNGEIKLDLGIKNRLDYSGYSLDDKLKGI